MAVAESIIAKRGDITVILLNRDGEVVVMSRTMDAGKIARELCAKAGGSGGGSAQFWQGKADFNRLQP